MSCQCGAYSASECGCGEYMSWESQEIDRLNCEITRLHAELRSASAIAERYRQALHKIAVPLGEGTYDREQMIMDARTALGES